jgi:hypothetical protein
LDRVLIDDNFSAEHFFLKCIDFIKKRFVSLEKYLPDTHVLVGERRTAGRYRSPRGARTAFRRPGSPGSVAAT